MKATIPIEADKQERQHSSRDRFGVRFLSTRSGRQAGRIAFTAIRRPQPLRSVSSDYARFHQPIHGDSVTKKPETPQAAPPVARRSKNIAPAGRAQMQALQAKFRAAREAGDTEREDTAQPTAKRRRY
jgi:hypothetical protein